jgi:hypothetical protein
VKAHLGWIGALVMLGLVVTGHGAQLLAGTCVLAAGWMLLGGHRKRVYRSHRQRQFSKRNASPGYMRETARHEAGHAIVARRLGGYVYKVIIRPDGSGATYIRKMSSLVHEVAVSYAGEYAAGTSRGCSGDHALTRAYLRMAPNSERARVHREGRALARRMVSRHSGAINSMAKRLLEKGQV